MKNISILYVEDDNFTRKIISEQLKESYLNLTIAKDGLEGLNKFKEKKFDIVITDINMPNLDGLQMIKKMKDIADDFGIIVISSYNDQTYIEEFVKFNFVRFLFKPINVKKLTLLIDELLPSIKLERKFKMQYKILLSYQKIIDSMLLVSRFDTKGNLIYVNDNFCKVSKYKKEELIGNKFDILRHPSISETLLNKEKEQLNKAEIFQSTIKKLDKFGKPFIVQNIVLPMIDDLGNIYEYFSVKIDITHHFKEKEEELSNFKVKSMKIFTHELKTPIHGIMGFSKHLTNKLKRLEQKHNIKLDPLVDLSKDINALSYTLFSSVTSILDMSKLEENKLNINLNKVNASILILEFLDIYNRIYQKELSYEIEPNIIINTDENLIKHIFENLYTNALKYGNSKVKVSLKKQHNKFIYSVEDDGKGISENLKEKIFELFEQIEEEHIKREKEGTGIGLHLVKSISQMLNYNIEVLTSENLGGAKFLISGDL